MTWKLKPVPGWTALALSVTSAVISGGVSYVIVKKELEKKFQEQLTTEIDDARSYFQQMYSTPTFVAEEPTPEEGKLLEAIREEYGENDSMPVDLVGNALSAARAYSGTEEEPQNEPGDPRPPAPVVINNIFTNATPAGEEVMDALMASRDPAEPYIITKEEFYQNDGDFEQKKFTYWEGDDILVDDQEEFNPIEDVERVAGEDNLLRFGYGSGDEHVLYIRNETLDPPLDLHITRSTGKYSVEVMALDEDEPHLQHSQPRKFRVRDE
jgi:hypothetical protein